MDQLAQLTANMEECKQMVAKLTRKQESLASVGVRHMPSKLAVAQWPEINDAHCLLQGGQRLVGLDTFESQVLPSLVAAGVQVYRYSIRMGDKAIAKLDAQMDRADKRPPKKVAYLRHPAQVKQSRTHGRLWWTGYA